MSSTTYTALDSSGQPFDVTLDDAKVRAWERTAKRLAELTDEMGLQVYLADDTLNLMIGPSHRADVGHFGGGDQQSNAIASVRVSGGGGAW